MGERSATHRYAPRKRWVTLRSPILRLVAGGARGVSGVGRFRLRPAACYYICRKMLEKPCISEPSSAPAFGGFLAWLRGWGLAFLMELYFGRAFYRQMVATMEILDRMLLAVRAGTLRPEPREIVPSPINTSRPKQQRIHQPALRARSRDAADASCVICQTERLRETPRTGVRMQARVAPRRSCAGLVRAAPSHAIRAARLSAKTDF